MYMTDMKPLKPLPHGNVLIVGTKSSNFDDEIRTHPRVIMWDGLHENWKGKSIPENVQAIFFTRFISHNAWGMIVSEARKKHLTVFNPLGTGRIAWQVRHLLAIPKAVHPVHTLTNEALTEKVEMVTTKLIGQHGKLKAFIPHIDLNINNRANAKMLLAKSKEMGIETTHDSLANFVGAYRRKLGVSLRTMPVKQVTKTEKGLDAAVQMLDNAIKELKDMREFLVATTNENKSLKMRLGKLKEMFND